jgi:hypothetical protein
VFRSRRGTPVEPRNVYRQFQAPLKKHDYRSCDFMTFATQRRRYFSRTAPAPSRFRRYSDIAA